MEFVRSMLQSTKLSKSFWGQAIATTYYLQNRFYTLTFGGKTPYKYWKGRKPILHHLKCSDALLLPMHMSLIIHEKNLS
jgi:hypothetical protein